MKRAILLLALIGLAGCTDATISSWTSYGKPHRVLLYSGGRVVGEWHTEGKVLTEKDSDGWYFKDSRTGALVRVSGTVVIEVITEPERKPQA